MKTQHSLSTLIGALALAASAAASAQSGATGTSSPMGNTTGMKTGSMADSGFVQKAAMGGAAEVAAGEAAQKNGSSESVKTFGTQMVQDHTTANEELKTIASGKGMDVPATPDAQHEKALAKMQAMSGAAFDKAFKAQMIADHKKTIALFKQESKSGKDADLKAFASKTLPTLEDHLKMAQALK